MKITQYNEYTENHKISLVLSDFIKMFMKSMMNFLDYLESDLKRNFIIYYLEELKELNTSNTFVNDFTDIVSEGEYREIFHLSFCYYMTLFNFNEAMINQSVEVVLEKFHQARYLLSYLWLKALCEVLDKENAIRLMKEYIDENIKNGKVPDSPKTLMTLLEKQTAFNIKVQDMEWTNIIINDYKYVNKVTKCKIHDIFKHLDRELIEVITCYPDFQMFKTMNPNFLLTRTQTLMSGAYCDTCYHDIRSSDLRHPEDIIVSQK